MRQSGFKFLIVAVLATALVGFPFLLEQADAALVDDQLPLPIESQPPAILVPGRVAGHDLAVARQLAEAGHDPLMPGIVEMGDPQNPAHIRKTTSQR